MLQKYSSWAIFLDGDFVRPILCICFLIATHESFCILNETRMTGDVGMLWHVDIVAWVSVNLFICLFVSVCFFVSVSYSAHVLDFTVQGVDLKVASWKNVLRKIFWGINVWEEYFGEGRENTLFVRIIGKGLFSRQMSNHLFSNMNYSCPESQDLYSYKRRPLLHLVIN